MKKHSFYLLQIVFTLMVCSSVVKVQAQTGSCVGTASLAVVIEDCTFIDEASFDNYYKMFPNPASETITIQCANGAPQDATVSLLNMVGQTLQQIPFSGYIMLDISAYPAGLYFITVQSGENITGKRIIIR
ncbi:hypothetical protein C7N43_33825 [Sphingobacteriales bacterium UPWRP_1]|nr:hypothetical protein C7N43_33825 [Sphingobacteriales bacterium UPWRP_1]